MFNHLYLAPKLHQQMYVDRGCMMLDVEAIMQSLWATVALFGYCIEYGRTYGWIKTSYFYLFAYKKKKKEKKNEERSIRTNYSYLPIWVSGRQILLISTSSMIKSFICRGGDIKGEWLGCGHRNSLF